MTFPRNMKHIYTLCGRMQCMLMLQYMIPLGFRSSETTKVYTFKFNPVYRVFLDLCKTGFIKEWLSDVTNTQTIASEHLHRVLGTSTNFIFMGYQVYVAL